MNSLPPSADTAVETQELVVVEPAPEPERPLKEKAIIAAVIAAVEIGRASCRERV